MRTVISIPDSVVEAADSLAKNQGISRSEFFRRAIETYIASCQPSNVQATLDAIYSQEESKVDDLLAGLQWASLPKEDW